MWIAKPDSINISSISVNCMLSTVFAVAFWVVTVYKVFSGIPSIYICEHLSHYRHNRNKKARAKLMRSIEVKKINLKSAMKAVLFASVIPVVLLVLFIILQVVVTNNMLSTGESNNVIGAFAASSSSSVTAQANSGLTQLIVFILSFVIYPVAIGLGALVLVFSYNLFASRLGGLKIMISENNDKTE